MQWWSRFPNIQGMRRKCLPVSLAAPPWILAFRYGWNLIIDLNSYAGPCRGIGSDIGSLEGSECHYVTTTPLLLQCGFSPTCVRKRNCIFPRRKKLDRSLLVADTELELGLEAAEKDTTQQSVPLIQQSIEFWEWDISQAALARRTWNRNKTKKFWIIFILERKMQELLLLFRFYYLDYAIEAGAWISLKTWH